MDLHVAPIIIEDGVWITSKCVVQMGVTIGRSAVVTPLSVVHRSLEAGGRVWRQSLPIYPETVRLRDLKHRYKTAAFIR